MPALHVERQPPVGAMKGQVGLRKKAKSPHLKSALANKLSEEIKTREIFNEGSLKKACRHPRKNLGCGG